MGTFEGVGSTMEAVREWIPIVSKRAGDMTREELKCAVILGIGAVFLAVIWLRSPKRKLNLPPGPRPVPLFGNLFFFLASKGLHRDLAKLKDKYGPLLWLWVGSQGTVVVQSPELAKEILKNQDSLFASRPPPPYASRRVTYDAKDVAFAPSGPHWRFMRKIMTQELLTTKRINEFQAARADEVERLLEAVSNHVARSAASGIKAGPVDLGYMLKALNINNITRMGMSKAAISTYEVAEYPQGNAAGLSSHEDRELIRIIQDQIDMVETRMIGDAVPSLAFIDYFFFPKAKLEQCMAGTDGFFARVIEEHRQYLKAHPGQKPRDFVDVLLGIDRTEEGAMTETLMKAQLLDMLGGGSDSSSKTTEWALAELLRNPAIYTKAMQELDQVVGRHAKVTEADIPNLPYLQAVVKETMRIHPVLPFLVPHYSLADTKVGGYDIPAKTQVLINAYALHLDPEYWQNPLQFDPERFIKRPDLNPQGHHFELIPFGSGKRSCPGMALGQIFVHIALARILQSFQWSLPVDVARPEDLDMSEFLSISLAKAVSLKAVPSLRQ